MEKENPQKKKFAFEPITPINKNKDGSHKSNDLTKTVGIGCFVFIILAAFMIFSRC